MVEVVRLRVGGYFGVDFVEFVFEYVIVDEAVVVSVEALREFVNSELEKYWPETIAIFSRICSQSAKYYFNGGRRVTIDPRTP